MHSRPVPAGRRRRAFFRLLLVVAATTAAALTGVSAAAAAAPPDGRAFEIVSPGDTGRNVIIGPYLSRDGNRVAYGALAAFDGAHSNVLNTYVATRTDSGWVNRPMQVSPRTGPMGWSPLDVATEDAGKVIAQGIPGLIGGTGLLLRRFNADGTPDGPPLIDHPNFNVQYATSTPDMTRNWIHSSESLVAGETFPVIGRMTYEVVNGEPEAATLLPGDAVPECGAALPNEVSSFQITTRGHVVSEDGDRIFFVSPDPQSFGCPTTDPPRLYTRANGDTVPISEAPVGETEQGVSFVGAAEDGSAVFFATGTPLVAADENESGDLYRYDVAADSNQCLSCVSGQEAFVNGGISSEDGSTAYFVSNADLVADPDANPGAPKVFVHDGTSLEFVANTGTLSPSSNSFPAGDLSFDGDTLMIQTTDQLTDFVTNGFEAIYRYTHADSEVVCVSCAPGVDYTAGASASVSAFTSAVATHSMSDDGSLIGFATTMALVSGDSNNGLDTYRWLDGELALVTDGVNTAVPGGNTPNHGYFGVDRTGANIVISSFDGLVPEHIGGVQFYTARIGGRFSPFPPPPTPECDGDACQGSPGGDSPGATPGSLTLNSRGNVTPTKAKPKKCRKGFVRRRVRGKVRCVRRQGQANRARRAADRTKKTALRRNK